MTTIPHGDKETDAGEETALGNAKEDTACKDATEVVYQAHASHDESPRDHDDSEPNAWTDALHHHVAWDFGRDVEGEENGKCDVVVETLHSEIDLQIDETRVTDIGTIKKTEATRCI